MHSNQISKPHKCNVLIHRRQTKIQHATIDWFPLRSYDTQLPVILLNGDVGFKLFASIQDI